MAAPKIVQIVADSVAIDGEAVTTVVALLEDGTVIFTGASTNAEWHRLPPVPSLDELD